MRKSPKIFIVSGPSGVGKNTVIAGLNFKQHNLQTPLTYTTREKRESEIAGRDYNFISKKEFLRLLKKNAWLEHTFFNKNYYGILKGDFEKTLKNNKNIIANLDIEGAKQIKEKYQDRAVLFFLKTTLNELKRRLVERGQNTAEQIRERLAIAKKEFIQSKKFYDYFIINKHNQSKQATKELEKIIAKNLR